MRFSGTVGYAEQAETIPGVWTDVITEYHYSGDVIRNNRHLGSPTLEPPVTQGELALENSFSILADAHAYANFMNMRYISWEGTNWKITNIEVRRPRLILTVGGQWDGNTA